MPIKSSAAIAPSAPALLSPVTDVGRYTFFVVVHPSVPGRTLGEFIDYARANPGKINYATGNTTGIVSTAFFASLAGIEMVHVPYKGEPQAVVDLLAGRDGKAGLPAIAELPREARPARPGAARELPPGPRRRRGPAGLGRQSCAARSAAAWRAGGLPRWPGRAFLAR